VPQGWYGVRPSDYAKSGFDKGHVVSSEDRGRSAWNPAEGCHYSYEPNDRDRGSESARGEVQALEGLC
jgi:DNA/RNA endonuclease G (NUC1)